MMGLYEETSTHKAIKIFTNVAELGRLDVIGFV